MFFLFCLYMFSKCSVEESVVQSIPLSPFVVIPKVLGYPVQAFLIPGNDGSHIMVDCGQIGDYEEVKEIFQKHDIRYIIITHVHPDHIGCLKKLKEDFPEKMRFISHENEGEYLRKGTISRTKPNGIVPSLFLVPLFFFLENVIGYDNTADKAVMIEPDIVFPATGDFPLKDELRNIYGIELIHTKGHTDGSLSAFIHESKEVIVGDMFCRYGFSNDFGYHFFVKDHGDLLESWKTILKMKPKQIYGSHWDGGSVTSEEIMKRFGLDEKDIFGSEDL